MCHPQIRQDNDEMMCDLTWWAADHRPNEQQFERNQMRFVGDRSCYYNDITKARELSRRQSPARHDDDDVDHHHQ